METRENNKLIAEFMGVNITTIDDIRKNKNPYISSADGHLEDDLKYHSSWNWLMSVVQKIKDTPTYGSIDGVDFVLTCDLTKENLYKSVVEFIKYHNEEKN